MNKDNFPLRIYRKFKMNVIQARWKCYVKSYPQHADSEFLRILGAPDQAQAVVMLRAQHYTPLLLHDKTLSAAEQQQAYQHWQRVDIFGSEIAVDDIPNAWHQDFIRGAQWPVDWHWQLQKVRGDGSDIKIPWELSRCQFLATFAAKYSNDNDRDVAEHFAAIVQSWIKNNPVGRGVNWACAMDVAIRAANWLIAYPAFESILSDDFVYEFYKSLYAHGRFIESNLEGPGWYAANHYLADLSGLFFIAVFCPAFGRKAKHWQQFAKHQLEKEIRRQVLSDGVYFEQSSYYHRLGFECFFYAYLLGQRNSIAFSDYYINQLKKMATVVAELDSGSGRLPQIGDNDSGMLFRLEQRAVTDLRYVAELGALFLNANQNIFNSVSPSVTSIRLAGKAACDEKLACLPPAELSPARLVAYPNAGWYLLKNRDYHCVAIAGGDMQRCHQAHAHDDRLSFELHYLALPIIVDCGTYLYTADPAARRLFRGRRCHNSLIGDAADVAELFYAVAPLSARAIEYSNDEQTVQWAASLDWKKGVWRREIRIASGQFSLVDRVDGVDGDTVACHGGINFHPDIMVAVDGAASNALNITLVAGQQLRLQLMGAQHVRLEKGGYSWRYGVKRATTRLCYEAVTGDCQIILGKAE